ncbi:SGNH/GDSL hydrolase family protein [Macrococcus armenti]|uniref:SGNH/GDSL hydrolase family protein n=1 Tax=Macrococcus armenti TaxID=2875764 RepID=UPI001CD285E2|nr:SGNH/GDSL hydrolase family protein [Macrococcus armenti]UBH10070.1 SGNH/GDSL hydrolase family protein [Macrococcus armenti]
MALNRTPSIYDRNWRIAENDNWDALEEGTKDAFKLWQSQPGNENKTLDEFFEFLSAKNDSITPDNTTFIVPDVNLFNKNILLKGGYYQASGYWADNAQFNSSDFIPVTPGKTYKFSSATITGHLTFWDVDGKFVTGIQAGTYNQQFTVPSNSTIRYLRFAISVNENIDTLMLVEGTTLPQTYQRYKLKLVDDITLSDKQLEKYITTDNIVVGGSKNLFNYQSMIITGKEIGTNGLVRENVNSAMIQSLPIDASKGNLTLSGLPTYNDGYNRIYSFEDENKAPLKTTVSDSIYRLNSTGTIAIPSNAKYVSVNLHANKTSAEVLDYSKTQIEYGTTPTPFEAYHNVVKSIGGYDIGALNQSDLQAITKKLYILIFGDSITETASMNDDGSNYVEGTRQNWLTFTTQKLEFAGVKNMAKYGAAWKDRVGVEERQKLSVQVNAAITQQHPADIIIIALGTNDGTTNLGDYQTAMSKKTLEELDRTNLYEAIRWNLWTIQSQPQWQHAIKFVSLPIQRTDYEPVQSLNNAIRTMAERYGFIVINMTTESQILRDFEVQGGAGRDLKDGLHPNENGMKKMANVFNRHIINGVQGKL